MQQFLSLPGEVPETTMDNLVGSRESTNVSRVQISGPYEGL